MPKDIDWNNLDFSYKKTDYRYVAKYKDGKWNEGEITEDNKFTLCESAAVFHYGQACFEGLKAFRTQSDDIVLFRPDRNAKRMNKSAKRIMMPEIPEQMFLDACEKVVKANSDWVPPFGSGASLYLRPFIIATGNQLAVKPSDEYIFCVFCTPVGSYFPNGMKPANFIVTEYDRAAPNGTGTVKVGGNYAASMIAHEEATRQGFADCLYLDAKEHKYIDEAGAANFFAITNNNKFITPKSESILPSITKDSLIYLAKNRLGLEVEERNIPISEIDDFSEAGACGTAAVVSPIGGISYHGELKTFYGDGKEVGPVTKKLYNLLTGIQRGEIEAPEGWIIKIPTSSP